MSSFTSENSVLVQLDQIPELRPFPQAATRLIAAVNDPNSDSKSLAEIIRCDPNLALRMLRMANSPLFGLPSEVRTVEQAVVIMGFRAAKDLAVSIAAADVFAQGRSARASRDALWKHSLATGTVARLLAMHMGSVNPDEAFLGGVVHDVGKLIFYDLVPEKYAELALRTEGQDGPMRVATERSQFGMAHTELGERCAFEWGLPREVTQAIAYHHEPAEAADKVELVWLTYVANLLAAGWGIVNPPASEFDAASLDFGPLRLDPQTIEKVYGAIDDEFAEVEAACGV